MPPISKANTINNDNSNYHSVRSTGLTSLIQKSQSVCSALVRQFFDTLNTWSNRHQQRRQLAEMDQWGYDDIGVSHAEVAVEIAKPFWVK